MMNAWRLTPRRPVDGPGLDGTNPPHRRPAPPSLAPGLPQVSGVDGVGMGTIWPAFSKPARGVSSPFWGG